MSGFAIFRATFVRDDFHGKKLAADEMDFTEYNFEQYRGSTGLNFIQ